MTTTATKAAILARLGDCAYHVRQAAAEGRAARSGQTWRDAQLELAATKAMAGLWRESRAAAEKGRQS
jgi:hypothetical protein